MVIQELCTNDLTEILDEKRELLRSILSSVRRSIDLLAGDSIDEFNSEMDKCQEYMHSVDRLNAEIAVLNAAEREKPAAAKERENDIVMILRQIADANMECNSAAKEKLRSFGYQIKALREKRQGLNMYAFEFGRNAAFVDVKL
jgi:hypothetical protein